MKNTIASKNSVDGLSSKAEMTQDRIRELENRSIELTQSDQQREKSSSLRDLGDNNRRTNICFIGVPEKREIRPKKKISRSEGQRLPKFGEKHKCLASEARGIPNSS